MLYCIVALVEFKSINQIKAGKAIAPDHIKAKIIWRWTESMGEGGGVNHLTPEDTPLSLSISVLLEIRDPQIWTAYLNMKIWTTCVLSNQIKISYAANLDSFMCVDADFMGCRKRTFTWFVGIGHMKLIWPEDHRLDKISF